jgi:hypothetical protein
MISSTDPAPASSRSGSKRSFSLVEVSVSTAVLGTAAVLLGTVMSSSSMTGFAAFRHGIARSLASRQMELIEANILRSKVESGTALPVEPGLRLANLRAAGQVCSLWAAGASTTDFQSGNATLIEANRYEISPTSNFHLLNATNMPDGSERDQLASQGLRMRVLAAAVRVDGFTAAGQQLPPSASFPGYTGDLRNLDLIMFQVVVFHTDDPTSPADGNQLLSVQRMFRVWSSTTFGNGPF